MNCILVVQENVMILAVNTFQNQTTKMVNDVEEI